MRTVNPYFGIFVIPLISLQLNNGTIEAVSLGSQMHTETIDYTEIERYRLENSVSADEVIREIQLKLKEHGQSNSVISEG